MPALASLLDHPEVQVMGLVCQPDKPVGRKQILTPPATKVLALEHGIPVFQPDRLRQHVDLIAGLKPDLIIVMAYGQIIPQAVLDLPRLGCWNLHASLLPRHRGAAPIQAAILAGDAESGITVMAVEAGLDSGPMLLHEPRPSPLTKPGKPCTTVSPALAPMALRKALPMILSGNPPVTPQDPAAVTHVGKLDRSHGVLDWAEPAAALARRIRAFHPWPGTSSTLPDGTVVKLFPPVTVSEVRTGCPLPGTLLQAGPDLNRYLPPDRAPFHFGNPAARRPPHERQGTSGRASPDRGGNLGSYFRRVIDAIYQKLRQVCANSLELRQMRATLSAIASNTRQSHESAPRSTARPRHYLPPGRHRHGSDQSRDR